MGWFNELFGDEGTKFTDSDVALDMLKDSKCALGALAGAIAEASTPELRQILKNDLTAALKMHFSLSDLCINNDWYEPNLSPAEQLKRDYSNSTHLTHQHQGG
ncbi:spore coat protein F precursor [Peptococcaceae bacterium CEB3]|nr:spore coat protein F precursor [Peptococcaceae bacterium CEB3]